MQQFSLFSFVKLVYCFYALPNASQWNPRKGLIYEDLGSPQWFQSPDHPILFQAAVPFDDDISATFIHRMILSDVNIYRAGRTEGLGGIRGFLAFPGRIRTRGGPFRVLSGT